jgi:hypothetical protein
MAAEPRTLTVPISRVGWFFFLLAIATAATGASSRNDDALARGRSLYLAGMHADGRALVAHNAGTDLPLPQAFVACVNCHGY